MFHTEANEGELRTIGISELRLLYRERKGKKKGEGEHEKREGQSGKEVESVCWMCKG